MNHTRAWVGKDDDGKPCIRASLDVDLGPSVVVESVACYIDNFGSVRPTAAALREAICWAMRSGIDRWREPSDAATEEAEAAVRKVWPVLFANEAAR